LAYNQQHAVEVMTCPVQGNGSGVGAVVAGSQNFSVVNGDASQQVSGNTTPLAFDYETRSCVQSLLLSLCF